MAKITEDTTIFDAIQINPQAGVILQSYGKIGRASCRERVLGCV